MYGGDGQVIPDKNAHMYLEKTQISNVYMNISNKVLFQSFMYCN